MYVNISIMTRGPDCEYHGQLVYCSKSILSVDQIMNYDLPAGHVKSEAVMRIIDELKMALMNSDLLDPKETE